MVRPAILYFHMSNSQTAPAPRIEWVDTARGLGILLVVAMHTILGAGLALDKIAWPHEIVAFAKPFRMPDFFLIAGLFAGRAINKSPPDFFDRKILFYVYFYALWAAIIYFVKQVAMGPGGSLAGFLFVFLEPVSDLWFIFVLPFFYLTALAVRSLPFIPVILGAIILHCVSALYLTGGIYTLNSNMTGWTLIDSYTLFLVFFLAGHRWRDWIFGFADIAAKHLTYTAITLCAWAIMNYWTIKTGLVALPGATLLFGLTGAMAVIAAAVLLSQMNLSAWIAYAGRQSLTIYLSFILPMAATRMVLIKLGWTDVAAISAVTIAVALGSPLLLERLTRRTPLAFLYHRPAWARLRSATPSIAPAR